MSEMMKKLECLYAWADFYKQNQRWDDWAKAQQQIDDYRRINKINR